MPNDGRIKSGDSPNRLSLFSFLMRQRKAIAELIWFALVGSAGFVIDIAVLKIYLVIIGDFLVPGDGLYIGQGIAWLISATGTWWLNRQFTFRHHRREPFLQQWFRFLAVNAIGGIANFTLYATLVALSERCRDYPVIALIAGTFFGMIFNFTGSRKLVFKPAD